MDILLSYAQAIVAWATSSDPAHWVVVAAVAIAILPKPNKQPTTLLGRFFAPLADTSTPLGQLYARLHGIVDLVALNVLNAQTKGLPIFAAGEIKSVITADAPVVSATDQAAAKALVDVLAASPAPIH